MCHGDESRPPAPPGERGGVASAGPLRLRAADGSDILAFQAVPERGTGAGVVLLPDARGLHAFYQDLARRFAETGIATVAIDYYGRSAPDDVRDETFNGFDHIGRLDSEQTGADIRAAVDHLVSGAVGPVSAGFTVGFCLGGAMSWGQSARDPRLAGVIGLYGRPVECRQLIPRMRAPVLVLAAGADMLTPTEDAWAFDRELTAAGVPHRFVLYDGAPHAFFDIAFAEHADAADDAWRQMLDFVARYTGAAQ